ncbi:pirin family protein [Pendulispora albinea]|uniref:Pirin family protein n=1 Tax=Pendulispora albinea TaxID=2741071 RepID=A0ABZ2M558_9BACT
MQSPILDVRPLGFPWETPNPFLFCVHHRDTYPAGNERLGPAASLAGRNLGEDFTLKDGWRMYHGKVVPGFPQHPHRGFETVTIVRQGYIDHADSLGAAARFGAGDVQWLTAGGGIVHSEMFPLLDREQPNTLELFQIWLNLPSEDKLTSPHFMLWSHDIPRVTAVDGDGRKAEITVVAGSLDQRRAPAPPPRSWASRADTDVAIWSIRLEPHAAWTLPRAHHPAVARQLYFFQGNDLRIGGETLASHASIRLDPGAEVPIVAGATGCDLLLLQGRPIAEPVVQYGPFVMNTRAEIERAFADYQRTRFGGWPWPADDPVHPRDQGRFARHVDGRVEKR